MHLHFRRIGKSAIIIAIFALAAGCGKPPFYNQYFKFANMQWHADTVPAFEVKTNRLGNQYRFIIQLRNTTDYRYSNIFFFLTAISPKGEHKRDTIECLLADRYGNWLGKGLGQIRENSFLIRHSMFLSDTGTYMFRLEQAMRDEVLNGVSDVGIRLEQINPSL